jgi:hypothetical protein
MTFMKRIGVATLIGCGLPAPLAQAGYVVTLVQVGSDVVATGMGAIDLGGLSFLGTVISPAPAQLGPVVGVISTGSTEAADAYIGMAGPESFGTGGQHLANTSSGDIVSITGFIGTIRVPAGYVSGHLLSDSATYDNQTFASLGVTPDTYDWTWGTGANQKYELDVVTVPAPVIGQGLPARLAVGGVLLGAMLWERNGKRRPLGRQAA